MTREEALAEARRRKVCVHSDLAMSARMIARAVKRVANGLEFAAAAVVRIVLLILALQAIVAVGVWTADRVGFQMTLGRRMCEAIWDGLDWLFRIRP